jgi:LysM repeat protein
MPDKKVPQPNWTESKARILLARMSVDGIVLHDTAGTGTHRDTLYLRDSPEKGRSVSVDFTAERDGSIWKLNPDLKKFACAHAGRATAFKGKRNGQVTRSTIGIEICQHVNLKLKPLYPQEQVRAVAHLCAWLCQEFKLTTSDITTHRQIITDGSRSDPREFPFTGENSFWHVFWDVQGKGDIYLASLGIQKVPEEGVRSYIVKPGDGFFAIARELKVKPADLVAANGMTLQSLIVPGQVLKVP